MRGRLGLLAASCASVPSIHSLGLGRGRSRVPTVFLCFSVRWFAHPLCVGLDCALAPESWLIASSAPSFSPRGTANSGGALVRGPQPPTLRVRQETGELTPPGQRLSPGGSAKCSQGPAMSWCWPCGLMKWGMDGTMIMEESTICSHPPRPLIKFLTLPPLGPREE